MRERRDTGYNWGANSVAILVSQKSYREFSVKNRYWGLSQNVGIVTECLQFYKRNSKHGERFGEIFKSDDFRALAEKYKR